MPPKKIKKQEPQWTYEGSIVDDISKTPPDSIGFIYLIENLTNGKKYFGRKTFRVLNKKKKLTIAEKKLPGNSRKIFKYVEYEYKGWQDYNGSCEPLLEDIKKGDLFKKTIVKFCSKKKQLTAWELKFILCDCFLDENCYNGNIMGKIFKKDFQD